MTHWLIGIWAGAVILVFLIKVVSEIFFSLPWENLFAKRSKCSRCSKLEADKYLKEFEGNKYCWLCFHKQKIEMDIIRDENMIKNDDGKIFNGYCELCKQHSNCVYEHEGKTYCIWCRPRLKTEQK